MTKMVPLPDKPTNSDLAIAIVAVHDCLDEHRQDTKRNFDAITGRLDTLSVGLGVTAPVTATHEPDQPKKKTVALMSPWQITWRMAAGFGVISGLYKILWAIAPSVWAVLKALNHVLVT